MKEKPIGGFTRVRYWRPEGLEDEHIKYLIGEVPEELRECLERERFTPEGLVAVAKMFSVKSGEDIKYCLTVVEERLTRVIYS